jgi:hypothetical protein
MTADWKDGPHLLTYRHTEYTFDLVAAASGKDEPDGLPPGPLLHICDALLEASIPGQFKGGHPAGHGRPIRPDRSPPRPHPGPELQRHRLTNIHTTRPDVFFLPCKHARSGG